MKSLFLLAGLVFSFNTWAQSTMGLDQLGCSAVSKIEQYYLMAHVIYAQRDTSLENHTIEQHIKKLDPQKLYFTQSDVDTIRGLMKDTFKKTQKEDCVFLTEVQALYKNKLEKRLEFVKNFLGPKYELDKKAEFLFDPEARKYAKDQAELEAIAQKYIHFQVANYVATDMKLPEAKSRVIKNYERFLKKENEVKTSEILSNYLDAYARALDPHSNYLSYDDKSDFDIHMTLSLEGIGATLSSDDGFTVVEALVPGGAAARSNKLQPKDKIVAVGQGDSGALENVIDMDLKDVVKKIRGKKGTKVRLSIFRQSGDKKEKFELVLVRDKVNLEDEAAKIYYIDKEIDGQKKKLGLIEFPSFYAGDGRSSAADMKKLIAQANEKKVDGIVLDLSTNGGGSLDDAVKIAGLFFKTGNVVKRSGRIPDVEETLKDIDPKVDFPGPLVVLTSRISASASEIVAGTMQDYKRAVILGNDHTFGKGTVQTVINLPIKALGAVKVTIGMFFTPGGNSTQHRGVDSDIVIPGAYTTDDIGEKSLDYSLPPKKIANFISNDAFIKTGAETWEPINPEQIKTLKDKSQKRVTDSADFKKIQEDLKKNQQQGKFIKISEILNLTEEQKKKKEKAKVKGSSAQEKEKEYLARADIQESLNVLGDLVSLEQTKVVADKNKVPPVTQ